MKIPTEDFADESLAIEVDNVAVDVTDMEVDKVTNMKTFLICHDFYGDGDGHGG